MGLSAFYVMMVISRRSLETRQRCVAFAIPARAQPNPETAARFVHPDTRVEIHETLPSFVMKVCGRRKGLRSAHRVLLARSARTQRHFRCRVRLGFTRTPTTTQHAPVVP
jgi:hypothetical protein